MGRGFDGWGGVPAAAIALQETETSRGLKFGEMPLEIDAISP